MLFGKPIPQKQKIDENRYPIDHGKDMEKLWKPIVSCRSSNGLPWKTSPLTHKKAKTWRSLPRWTGLSLAPSAPCLVTGRLGKPQKTCSVMLSGKSCEIIFGTSLGAYVSAKKSEIYINLRGVEGYRTVFFSSRQVAWTALEDWPAMQTIGIGRWAAHRDGSRIIRIIRIAISICVMVCHG